jgi:hypothetical protein
MRIELEGIWKESTAVYFQATITEQSEGTKENHEKFCLDKWSHEDKIWTLDFPEKAHERWKIEGEVQFFWITVKQIFNILYTVARGLLYATVLHISYKKIEGNYFVSYTKLYGKSFISYAVTARVKFLYILLTQSIK